MPIISMIKCDLKYKSISDVNYYYRNYINGVAHTLCVLNIGYSGANNTPTEIFNIQWYKDVVLYYAYWEYLKEKGVVMPDFEKLDSILYNVA